MLRVKKREADDIKLASGSPRREELLKIAGWNPLLSPVEIQESVLPYEDPQAFARRLALEKAKHAIDDDGKIVLGADTIVVLGDRVLGKPQDERDAVDMLEDLRGRDHQVVTAIALIDRANDRWLVDLCNTDVPMRDYSKEEIEDYVATGSPMDKAGAYGIQDDDFHPVDLDSMVGCFANVMGLPLCHLVRALRNMEIQTPDGVYEKCMEHTRYHCRVYWDILKREA
jgi:septum formation protein